MLTEIVKEIKEKDKTGWIIWSGNQEMTKGHYYEQGDSKFFNRVYNAMMKRIDEGNFDVWDYEDDETGLFIAYHTQSGKDLIYLLQK